MFDRVNAFVVTPVKNFVTEHKFAIGVTVGLTAGLALNKRNMNQVDEFLKENDLYDEYWNLNEE
jgi:hypothetical protein